MSREIVRRVQNLPHLQTKMQTIACDNNSSNAPQDHDSHAVPLNPTQKLKLLTFHYTADCTCLCVLMPERCAHVPTLGLQTELPPACLPWPVARHEARESGPPSIPVAQQLHQGFMKSVNEVERRTSSNVKPSRGKRVDKAGKRKLE